MSALTPSGDTFEIVADLPDVPAFPAVTDGSTWNGWVNVWIDTATRDALLARLEAIGDTDSADDVASLPAIERADGPLYSLNGYCVTINANRTAATIAERLTTRTAHEVYALPDAEHGHRDDDAINALVSILNYQRMTAERYPATFCRDWLPNGSNLPY